MVLPSIEKECNWRRLKKEQNYDKMVVNYFALANAYTCMFTRNRICIKGFFLCILTAYDDNIKTCWTWSFRSTIWRKYFLNRHGILGLIMNNIIQRSASIKNEGLLLIRSDKHSKVSSRIWTNINGKCNIITKKSFDIIKY